MIEIEPVESMVLYVYEKDILKHKMLSDKLMKGFDVTFFSHPHVLKAALENQSAQIVFVPFDPKDRELISVVVAIKSNSPQTQVIGIIDKEMDSVIMSAMDIGTIDDFIFSSSDIEVMNWGLRRTLERLALLRMAEGKSLKEKSVIQKLIESAPHVRDKKINLVPFSNKLSEVEWIRKFLIDVSEHLDFCPIVYLKYYSSNKTLHVFESSFVDKNKYKGVGLNLSNSEDSSDENFFSNLGENKTLNEFLKVTFGFEKYQARVVYSQDQIQGIIVFADHTIVEVEISAYTQQLQMGMDCIGLKSKLFSASEKEKDGKLINRKSFEIKIKNEMKRLQRISHPMTLVVIRFDAPFEMTQAHYFPLLQAFERNSRAYDIWGRVSSRDIGVVLPHADSNQAKEKIKRINTLIQMIMANVSKFKMNFYFGLAEYPTHANNPEALIEAAQSACDKAFAKAPHTVCEYKPVQGFEPEFSTSPYYSVLMGRDESSHDAEI